jgi:N-acetylmuramoyl-L-alanine amidase
MISVSFMRKGIAGLVVGLLAASATPLASAPLTRFTTVVIDAGHGGYDRGGVPGQLVPEKTVTLDVAQRLRTILQGAGYNVIMTRRSDEFVPLGTRVAIANAHRQAIFISVHFNSARRRGANGIETYFYSTESAPLAASIHSNVLASAPSENRGVRRRGYFVLRRTTIPAVLVECGFLTNPTEARYAQITAYRQQLAQQIARGILARPALATRTSYTNRSSRVDVGLQPFLDQRYVRTSKSSKRHRSKSAKVSRSKKIAAAKKKKSSSSSEE